MLKNSLRITVLMLAFKIFGFIKQIIVAKYFGASSQMDMYSLTYSFVNQPGAIIAESLMLVVITKFPQIREKDGEIASSKYLSSLITAVLIIFTAFTILIIGGSNIIASIIAKDRAYLDMSILRMYIIAEAPYIVFITIAHVLNSVLEVQKKFVIPRLESFINSTVIILFVVIFSDTLGGMSLIIADIFSAIIYLMLVLYSVNKLFKIGLANPFSNKDLRDTVLLMLPLLIGNAAYRINQIIDSYLSASIEGGASALSYSHVLTQLVTVTLGTAMVNVMYSYTATYSAKKREDLVDASILKMLKVLVIILLPISVISVIYGKDIVSIAFMRGTFDKDAVNLTAEVFIGYAVAFVFVLVKSVFDKVLILHENSKLITVIGIISLFTNVILSVFLLKHIGLMGISLATSIVTVGATIFMAFYINGKYIRIFRISVIVNITKIIVALIFSTSILYIVGEPIDNVFFDFLLKIVIFFIIYFACLYIVRVIPHNMVAYLKNRISCRLKK